MITFTTMENFGKRKVWDFEVLVLIHNNVSCFEREITPPLISLPRRHLIIIHTRLDEGLGALFLGCGGGGCDEKYGNSTILRFSREE